MPPNLALQSKPHRSLTSDVISAIRSCRYVMVEKTSSACSAHAYRCIDIAGRAYSWPASCAHLSTRLGYSARLYRVLDLCNRWFTAPAPARCQYDAAPIAEYRRATGAAPFLLDAPSACTTRAHCAGRRLDAIWCAQIL